MMPAVPDKMAAAKLRVIGDAESALGSVVRDWCQPATRIFIGRLR
jgi:hypothetical protein